MIIIILRKKFFIKPFNDNNRKLLRHHYIFSLLFWDTTTFSFLCSGAPLHFFFADLGHRYIFSLQLWGTTTFFFFAVLGYHYREFFLIKAEFWGTTAEAAEPPNPLFFDYRHFCLVTSTASIGASSHDSVMPGRTFPVYAAEGFGLEKKKKSTQ